MPETIPTITLWQPWASLVVHGHKRIETRSWPYRGALPCVLAIHAGARIGRTKSEEEAILELCMTTPFCQAVVGMGYGNGAAMPRSAVVGLARLVACVRTDTLMASQQYRELTTSRELRFGDFSPNRYGWVFDRAVLFDPPIEAKGNRQIWLWPATDTALMAARQLMEVSFE